MMPVALFYSLFGTESPCLPVGRENARLPAGKTETPKYGLCANYILASFTDWQSSG
jgi:hypothetical protein